MTTTYNISQDIYNELFRYASALTGCEQDGFDALHEVILTWGKLDKSTIEQAIAYLKRMLRNHIYDQRKMQTRRRTLLEAFSTDQQNEEKQLEDVIIDHSLLEQLWNGLSCEEREILYVVGS